MSNSSLTEDQLRVLERQPRHSLFDVARLIQEVRRLQPFEEFVVGSSPTPELAASGEWRNIPEGK